MLLYAEYEMPQNIEGLLLYCLDYLKVGEIRLILLKLLFIPHLK